MAKIPIHGVHAGIFTNMITEGIEMGLEGFG
ncbi:unnamed protein product, partial [marine sediment metagenome]